MRHYPCYKQDGKKDCGVCCLLMIIKTYKGEVSKEYLRTLTKTDRNGVNAYYIMQAAKQIGFSVEGVEGDFRKLSVNQLPCIAHVIINKSYRHFVVIYEIQDYKEKIVIADPALGIRTLSYDEFSKISTSKYLLFEPDKPILISKQNHVLREAILSFLNDNKGKLFLGFLFSCFVICLNICFSFSFQLIMKDGIELNAKQNILFLFIVFLFLLCISTGMNYIRLKITIWIQKQLDLSIFKIIIDHLFHLPYLYFKTRTTGEVLSRLSEIQQLQEGLGMILLTFIIDIMTIILISIVAYILSPLLSLVLFLTFLVLALITGLQLLTFRKSVDIFHMSYEAHNSHLTEMIQGINSIKNMQAEDYECRKIIRFYQTFLSRKKTVQESFLVFAQIENIMTKLPQLLLLLAGGYIVLDGKMEIGQLFTIYHLSSYYLQSTSSFLHFFYEFQLFISTFKRIEDLLSVPKEEIVLDKRYVGGVEKGQLEVRNLTYHYNSYKEIFSNFSFVVATGERVMIYGDSGCGKSTLAKLILRYIPVENNMIFLGGKDINNYSLIDLRSTISYLSQNELLFTGSIFQNIVWERDVSYDEFLEVARVTRVDEIIKRSSLGYDYLIEENGFNLSGGEKQRVLLARSLLKKASIYIFDESFSEIDINTEREILEAIFKIYQKTTFIIVSHRFSNQDIYDRKINMG